MDALAPGAMTTPPRAPAGAVGGGGTPPRAWRAWAREHRHRQIRIIRLAGRAREAGTRRRSAAAADTRHWAGRGAATCAASLPGNKRPRRNPMRILWWIHTHDATRISGRCWTLWSLDDGRTEEGMRSPCGADHPRTAHIRGGRCRSVVPWPPALHCRRDANGMGHHTPHPPTHPPVGCTVPPETAIKIRQLQGRIACEGRWKGADTKADARPDQSIPGSSSH